MFFYIMYYFLGDKLDKSAKNEDEILLNTLNKADHNWLMTNNWSFLPISNNIINIKTKYIVRGS